MAQVDTIKEIAQQVLQFPTNAGMGNNWLWDRTQRIVGNIELVCQIPEVTGANMAVDRFCLTTAAYFADAGFTNYIGIETIEAGLVLADINTNDLREFSTQIVFEQLGDILDQSKVNKINRIITESNDHFSEMNEAMILSDARNLEDIGIIGVFNEFCACGVHGKGVCDILESWKKKVDYRYWEARLKESFSFESVRKVAVRRFAQAEKLMNQLAVENSATDVKEVTLESLTQND
jgi:hypothetical protein